MYLHKSLDENGIEKKTPIFEAGDIVYFINYDRKVPKINRRYRVDIGMAYDDYYQNSEVKVSSLVPKEDRLVNGVVLE